MRPILIATVLGAFVAAAQPAHAQRGPCDQRTKVLALLAERYHETPVLVGVTSSGSLVEVLTDANGGTWTIIVTSPQGMSCLMLSGDGWRTVEQVAQEPGV